MDTLRNGHRLHWRLDGTANAPPIVLLHAIGTDLTLWDEVTRLLAPQWHVLRIDLRGHGASATPPGRWTLDAFADDVAACMDAAGVARAVIAGVSLGGMVAMVLALRAPERVAGLGLVCTSAAMDAALWEERVRLVRDGGMAAVTDLALARYLAPGFAAAHPDIAEALRVRLLASDPQGYALAGEAIAAMNLLGALPAIRAPALLLAGRRDLATPYDGHGDRIAARLAAVERRMLDTGHLPPLEDPCGTAAALHEAFTDPADKAAAATLFEAGLTARRRILGDAWVDAALARADAFDQPFQALITRGVWREIWSRPGLDDRTRRLLVLAITASLGRWEEFALHVRSGLSSHGFTRSELSEVLLQLAAYAGVPAANSAFAEARAIIAALDDAPIA